MTKLKKKKKNYSHAEEFDNFSYQILFLPNTFLLNSEADWQENYKCYISASPKSGRARLWDMDGPTLSWFPVNRYSEYFPVTKLNEATINLSWILTHVQTAEYSICILLFYGKSLQLYFSLYWQRLFYEEIDVVLQQVSVPPLILSHQTEVTEIWR